MSKKEKRDWTKEVESTLEGLKTGQKFDGKDGLLTGLIKKVIEAALEEELEHHLKESKPNRRNGKSQKQVKSIYGNLEIESSRDRDSSFSPQIVPKRQTYLTQGLEDKILSLFSHGMSYNDIISHMEEMYGVEVSSGMITAITDKLIPIIEEWRSRPLEEVYPIIYLDGIYFKSRNEQGVVVRKVAYTVLGVDLEGQKDVLGIYLWEGSESAKLWMQVLDDLKGRGVKDILIACTDNLTGFEQAIEGIYPETRIQLCIIHQLRNTMKYISWKDSRELMQDLKKVYQATTKELAEHYLHEFEKKWGAKYPSVIRSWRENWPRLSQYFRYPQQIRKLIYTTNLVEGYHRNIRKRTKTKAGFTSDKAIIKLLYLSQEEMKEKWGKIHGWSQILLQLEIIFEQRLNKTKNA